ncbi:hypothetical protein GDO78_017487 [Eleutherodactylus coqui]|uniref:Uncharacterized protein n=1 Tax=Eleutherodactylus coqui TaxID=57060 RepID=A0A8J6B5X3_ELECQ|nr:hypothetical protein GDO78_017487 [Eleutherodactylus coqui]
MAIDKGQGEGGSLAAPMSRPLSAASNERRDGTVLSSTPVLSHCKEQAGRRAEVSLHRGKAAEGGGLAAMLP